MSSLLYRLGRSCYRGRKLVALIWGVLLALAVVLGLSLSQGTNDTFTIPGVESQTALDTLQRVFPEVAGTSAQVVITLPQGHSVKSSAVRTDIADSVKRLAKIDQVIAVVSPFDTSVSGAISTDKTTAVIAVQFDVEQADLDSSAKSAVQAEAKRLQSAIGTHAQVFTGGDAFSNRVPQASATEAVGVVIALVLLLSFFGSIGAAFVPIGTAVLGVIITEMIIQSGTSVLSIMSTAPMLATMIGLAVGIDYALFVLSRHRDQLRAGLDAEESTARAVATAGSAVVFAGMTVIIALLGLFVAGMPFLTIMGVAAALGVAVAVLIALTVIPAVLGFFGDRMRPRPSRIAQWREARRAKASKPTAKRARRSLADRWVSLVTKVPALTVALVLVAVAVMAWPAGSLRLALPGNGSEPVGNSARDTYDLLAEKFGPGYNGPLIITVNLLSSHTPVADMKNLRADLLKVDGVASVPLATPNSTGSVGIAQVIPTGAPDSEETSELVVRLRAAASGLEAKYGFRDFSVTGITAVAVDVSTKLGQAMLPFGLLVVGLSLVLLVMVFGSVAVPIKATLGYVLSVLAAFGATSLVFVQGWGADLIGVAQTGYVVSFLPIILMGVLFGLAMDYEVFLVSRTAEVYSHTGDPQGAIKEGFVKAAPVVTLAALIMLGVFVSFIHEDNAIIKPIAFALSVGVFVDAFLVRMTLVPAVLQLLGTWAWWMPTAWHKRLPRFDVEGEGLTRQLRLADWPTANSQELVSAAGLTMVGLDDAVVLAPVDLHVHPGEFHLLAGAEATGKSAALYAISGRVLAATGDLKVTGLVLPDRAHHVRQRCALIPARQLADPEQVLADAVRRRVKLVLIDDLDAIVGEHRLARIAELIATVLEYHGAVVATAAGLDHITQVLPGGVTAEVHQLSRPIAHAATQEALS